MSTFDAVGAVLSYLRARGSAPEDDILRVLDARVEEHYEQSHPSWRSGSGLTLCGVRLLAQLVETGRLRWKGAPGKRGDLGAPLIYSLSRREARRSA